MVFPGKNPSEDREMRHGIRETVQMAPGRVGPVFPQAPMPRPSAPAADHVVPEPDSSVAAPPQVPRIPTWRTWRRWPRRTSPSKASRT